MEYIRWISSPAFSVPSLTVNSLKPKFVNQSFSVPIQPDMAPPAPALRSLISLM